MAGNDGIFLWLGQRGAEIAPILGKATVETLLMVLITLVLATLVGVPLGIILVVTRPGHILASPRVYQGLNLMINLIRAIPFIILMVALLPLSRQIVGTTIGVKGAIVPLTIFTIPFIGRVVESALLEVDPGLIEAFQAMGATPFQIIYRVLIKESKSGLILALTIAAISLIGASAMAGIVGAGGLGDLAIRFGYVRYEWDVMIITIIVLIILVQGVQSLGNRLAASLKKR